jgi:Ser-tRNA(Ala) deacylase AlaX
MTNLLYLTDASLDGQAIVTGTGTFNDQHWATLDRTLFHRAGGGQKADRGFLNDIPVLDVRLDRECDRTLHIVSTNILVPGQCVEMHIDRAFRDLNSKYHTAGHLLATIIERDFGGLQAVAGHHYLGEARVEFEGEVTASLETLMNNVTNALQTELATDTAVSTMWDSEEIRHIQIGKYPPTACGGTHVSSTKKLVGLYIKSMKQKSGRLRVSYDFAS